MYVEKHFKKYSLTKYYHKSFGAGERLTILSNLHINNPRVVLTVLKTFG